MYINRVGSNTILQERSTKCTVSYNYTCDLCQFIQRSRQVFDQLGMRDYKIACCNGPQMIIVSGPRDSISQLGHHFRRTNIMATDLDTSFGFHSAQVDTIVPELGSLAAGIPFEKPYVPMVSSLLASAVQEKGIFGAKYLQRHTPEMVNFAGALAACRETFDDSILWIEFRPHPACLSMIAASLDIPTSRLCSTLASKKPNWGSLSTSLAKLYESGVDISWSRYDHEYRESLHLVNLPSYFFDHTSHWILYEGDWCLWKSQNESTQIGRSDITFISSSLHRLDAEQKEASFISLTFSSDPC